VVFSRESSPDPSWDTFQDGYLEFKLSIMDLAQMCFISSFAPTWSAAMAQLLPEASDDDHLCASKWHFVILSCPVTDSTSGTASATDIRFRVDEAVCYTRHLLNVCPWACERMLPGIQPSEVVQHPFAASPCSRQAEQLSTHLMHSHWGSWKG
jgi:hypothetical protein